MLHVYLALERELQGEKTSESTSWHALVIETTFSPGGGCHPAGPGNLRFLTGWMFAFSHLRCSRRMEMQNGSSRNRPSMWQPSKSSCCMSNDAYLPATTCDTSAQRMETSGDVHLATHSLGKPCHSLIGPTLAARCVCMHQLTSHDEKIQEGLPQRESAVGGIRRIAASIDATRV